MLPLMTLAAENFHVCFEFGATSGVREMVDFHAAAVIAALFAQGSALGED